MADSRTMADPGLADTDPPVPSQPIPNTLIVRFLPSVGEAAQKTHLDNLTTQCSKYPSEGTTKYPGVTRVFARAMKGYTGKFHPTVEKWIKAQPGIVVEADVTIQMAANVTNFTNNWGLGVVSGFTDKTNKYSHSTLGGQGVVIHILDDGFTPVADPYVYSRLTAEEIEANRVIYANSDKTEQTSDKLHGYVAALLAAGKTLGAAPQAKISVHRVTDRVPGVDKNGKSIIKSVPSVGKAIVAFEEVLVAVDSQPNIPRVVNCSWAIDTSTVKGEAGITSFKLSLGNVIDEGCIVVVAAGNHGVNLSKDRYLSPTGWTNLITVGSVDRNGKPSETTNFGSSAPLVSGMIACLLAEHKAAAKALPSIYELRDLFQIHWNKVTDYTITETDQEKLKAKNVKNGDKFHITLARNYAVTPRKDCPNKCTYCTKFPFPLPFET